MKKKHSKALLISIIPAIFYIGYFAGSMSVNNIEKQLGSSNGITIITLHIALLILAIVFNYVAYLTNKSVLALTTVILFLASGISFLPYILFIVPSIVLSFLGYINLKKINLNNKNIFR